MTYTYTGPVPPTPPASGATQSQWDNWWAYQRQLTAAADLAERALYRGALEASTAATRDDTASRDRLEAATRANTDMLKSLIDEMVKALTSPTPRQPATRAELAAMFLAHMPELTSFTDLQMADAALKRADALLARLARV